MTAISRLRMSSDEYLAREAGGGWLLWEYRGSEEAPIDALGGVLRLDELYLKVI